MLEGKKLVTYYILKTLQKYSDEAHPMTQDKISAKIATDYGVEVKRKSVSVNIELLRNVGYEIETVSNKGCYLGARRFEPSEISFLVDAIFTSRSIDSVHAHQLAEKLYEDYSQYERKQFSYLYKADQLTRTDNRQLFYSIDIINQAISEKRQVKFDYIGYSSTGKTVKPAEVTPYYLVSNNGRYYLVCNRRDPEWGIANYRVERIENITVSDTPATPIDTVKGCEKGFDIVKYANESIYMFGGPSVKARLELENEQAIGSILDWFGKEANIRYSNGRLIADITVNETALLYWALQYGEVARVVAPADTKERIKSMLADLTERYS